VTLLEPDVALTDFGLAAECAALAAWLHWRSGAARPLQTWFVIFFSAVGIGAFLGGITHGFLADIQSTIYGVIWSATMLAIGLAAVASWAIGAHLLFSERAAKRVVLLAGSLFALYAATVLAVSQSFTVAVVFYVPAVTFVLITFVLTYLRRPRNDVLAGIAGLILSFAAAAIQQTETAILGLTYNALYHLVQAVALLLIFVAARGLTRET
jgi:hypothetical protein